MLDDELLTQRIVGVVHAAGELLCDIVHKCALNPVVKDARSQNRDLVTRADQEVEAFLKSQLLREVSYAVFIGEEETGDGARVLGDAPTVVVDAVDGTTNLVCADLEHVCISVGFCLAGRPLIGVVYQPWTQEMYVGCRGRASTLNGVPIEASRTSTVEQAMVQVGLTSKLPHRHAATIALTYALEEVRAPRIWGCAGLSMCAVAVGVADLYLVPRLNVWDVLAPSVILQGAGGRITDAYGEPWQPRESSVVMSNGQPAIHEWGTRTLSQALIQAGVEH